MITCSQCGRENEIFFKFCLGCGAELVAGPPKAKPAVERAAPAPRPERRRATVPTRAARVTEKSAPPPEEQPTPPEPAVVAQVVQPVPEPLPVHEPEVAPAAEPAPEPVQPAAEAAPEPAAASAAAPVSCHLCGHMIEEGHLFCGSCGARTDEAPAPVERAAAVDQRTQVTAARVGKLVLIRADRTDGAVFPLYEGVNSFGRDDTDISFPQDDFLAPRHLDLLVEPDSVRVVPHTTVNGTFHRTKKSVRLSSGAQFRIGQELLQLEVYSEVPRVVREDGTVPLGAPIPSDVWGRLLVVVGAGAIASAFLLQGEEVVMGREVGTITFPHDGYVSGRHAALRYGTDGSVTLTDLGSSNGTYVRLSAETPLATGDVLLAGQQLFRVQI